MLLIIIAALLAFFALALFWPIRLEAHIRLRGAGTAKIRLFVKFFGGIYRLRFSFLFFLFKEPALSLYTLDKRGRRREAWALGRTKGAREGKEPFPIRTIWDHLRIRGLRVWGEAGVFDDACSSVLLAGALTNMLQLALLTLIRNKNLEKFECFVSPYFKGDRLRLNLEGIAGCRPIHIIIAMVMWYWNNRKGKKTVWHTQSKTL